MSKHKKDVTITNPLQRIGKFHNKDTNIVISGMVGSAIGLVAMLATGSLLHEDIKVLPDTEGTELSTSVLESHQQTLTELKALDYKWHKMKVDQDFGKLSSEGTEAYTELKNSFAQHAQKAVFDLYTKGATNEGAAISEQDFEQKLDDLMKVISGHANLKNIGYNADDVYPSMLDEALANVKLPTDNSVISQFNAVKDIQSYMADNKSNESDNKFSLLLAIAFAPMIGFPLIGGLSSKRLSRLPKRITIRKAKPNH